MADTAAVNFASQNLFRNEYELEMEDWLRRRFRAVCICYIGMGALILIMRLFIIGFGTLPNPWLAMLITTLAGLASLGVVLRFLLNWHWVTADRREILRGASVMILALGAISTVKALVMTQLTPEHASDFLLPLFFWHLITCLFLPWTPRESLRPMVPLLAVWAVGVLIFDASDIWVRIIKVVFGPGILVPGLVICAMRLQYHGEKFRIKMVGKHFLSMRQEFTRARTIHESMFPAPHDDGFVRFEYTYKPMREIGGDYVHLHVGPEGMVHLMLLDVTGHGLAAALTVNRLFGELERIRAEMPLAEPGEVLSLLNRYINLTMVKHNIFATALCITLDPYAGKLHFSNAGHPPGFLRGANGVVTKLPASAVLLGALDGREFVAGQRTIELSPGDVVVTYTDGAFESRDRRGESFGLQSLDQMMHTQPPPRNWPQFLTWAVEKHSAGRLDDDILIAALTFMAPRPQPAIVQHELAAS